MDANVIESSNRHQIGLSGQVVDETKNMLVLRTNSGIKRVQKKGAKFAFELQDKKVLVYGTGIIARPEDRIKLKVKKW